MVKIVMEKNEKRVCEKARVSIEFTGTTYIVRADNGLHVFGDELIYEVDKIAQIATIRVDFHGLTIAFINYEL